MNIHINKLIYYRWIYIIRTWTTAGHILFGHKSPLDIYYLDIYHRLTYMIWI